MKLENIYSIKQDRYNKCTFSAVVQVNVRGLENVLKAAKRTPTVKKIVYTSSFFAIGPTDGYVADETQVKPYS